MEYGLALSGGGARGAAHIGVLQALVEEGLAPSMVSGTSAGAMVGGLYACGYTPEEIASLYIDLSPRILDYNFLGLAAFLIGLIAHIPIAMDGLIRGAKLGRVMRDLFAEKGVVHLNDARVPLAVTAVDVNTAKLIYFVSHAPDYRDADAVYCEDAELWQAVRASTAVPAVFRPEMMLGRRLVDGGVRDNLPAQILRDMGAQRVLAVNLGYAGQRMSEVNNVIEIANQSLDIMSYQISRQLVKAADYVLLPGIYDVSLLELDKIPATIRRGYEACRRHMPGIRAALNTGADGTFPPATRNERGRAACRL